MPTASSAASLSLATAALCFLAWLTLRGLETDAEVTSRFSGHVRRAFARQGQAVKGINSSLPLNEALVRDYAVNDTLVVTFANANHVDYTLNWKSYLDALNISNYIVGAVDSETASAMALHNVHYFTMFDSQAEKLPELPAGDLTFGTPGFLSTGLHRLVLYRAILDYHIDIVCSDVDTVWLKNPMQYFASFPEADILASSDALAPASVDGGLDDPQILRSTGLNIGLMLIRYSDRSVRFLEAWSQLMQQQDRPHWDQADFNDLLKINMFTEQAESSDNAAAAEDLTLLLPMSGLSGAGITHSQLEHFPLQPLQMGMFSLRRNFMRTSFVSLNLQKLQTSLYIAHANYIVNGALKKVRFRETLLWRSDKPSYYSTERLLTFDLHNLEAPHDWLELPVHAQAEFHAQNLALQLIQFWDAAAAAVALDRVLVLPQFTCYCDENWHTRGGCAIVQAVNHSHPFACPPDYVIMVFNMNDDPSEHGAALEYKESTFLQNAKTPEATKADVVEVTLPTQDMQISASPRVNQTWAWASWSVTEDQLRNVLYKYSHHRVLHFREMGHILLNEDKMWLKRQAHATYDVCQIRPPPRVQWLAPHQPITCDQV